MLKSSSLCLYSSNLGTFWLKIEQFRPFKRPSWMEGVAIGHNFERAIPSKFGLNWLSGF